MKALIPLMRYGLMMLCAVIASTLPPHNASAATPYDMGSPVLADLWVDPVQGDDSRSGASQAEALRTLTAAWNLANDFTNTGYRINLLPGTFTCEPSTDNCLNYFASRYASFDHPLIVQAANGAGTVTIQGGLNLYSLSSVYFIDLDLAGGGSLPTNSSGNNLLHLSNSDRVLLRGLRVLGPDCDNDQCNNLQEVLKVNQTQNLYVEESELGGAWHTVVDCFALQYGHFINNTMHTAGQWGMYLKGGSAYLTIEGNEIRNTYLGFQAGQSSNLAVMWWPWLHYEAYDIRFINNILHDIPGVGMSVAGGYNILFANNTLYNVATDSANGYPFMQAVFGERGCTATDEIINAQAACQDLVNEGGWGPNDVMDNQEAISNRNVYVYNNIFYNPTGNPTLYGHFTVWASRPAPLNFVNIPDPVQADTNLSIRGNVIWNGPADHPLGIEYYSGCADSNPTCNATQLRADNTINQFEPQFTNPGGNDFRPLPGGNLTTATSYAIPDFGWNDLPTQPSVPTGTLSNQITTDFTGAIRGASSVPGAYSADSTPSLSDADRLFNWLEYRFPELLSPAGEASQTIQEYYYRYYAATDVFLVTVSGKLYYYAPSNNQLIIDLGWISDFLAYAAADGY